MVKEILTAAREASRRLNLMAPQEIDNLLLRLADNTVQRTGEILAANRQDLARMDQANPKYDRLLLNESRIGGIADGLRRVASLPSPVGITLDQWTRPNGMRISKVSVPFGVIGVIYEARPNVSFDVFALCHIASLREQGDLLPLLDTVATRVPLMDSRVSRMIDKSLLSLIDKGKIEREKILAYLNGRIAQVDKNTAAEYKSAMLEAGVEGGIVFEELSLEEALKKAAEEGKYVFLDCYTSWCGPCKVMSKQVFVRKAVGDLFNPTCINIKIDMEKGEGPEIAKRYGVQAYPTMFVLNSDGSVKYRLQGGMEAGHFLVKARNALDPTISYTELKGYGSLSACPLEKQADYIIALCDGGELRDATKEIASYLKDVEGRTALYPTVWKLCNHFSDRYTDPVFQFVVSHWADFSFVPKTELELKIERLIFPQYIEYLAGNMSPADFVGLKNLVEQADFRKDYSLVYLDRIVAAYDQKDWEGLMACYENEIAHLQDAKVRLNLDVLLHYFAAQAPASVKDKMVAYVQKCIATADSKALNGYNNLLMELRQ